MLVPTPFRWSFSTEIFASLIKQEGSQRNGFVCKEVVDGWLVRVSVKQREQRRAVCDILRQIEGSP